MRKTFLAVHRWLGLVFGVFIGCLCFSGALLVFQKEIVHALNADKYTLAVAPGAQHLDDAELERRVEEQLADDEFLMFINVSEEPTAPATAMIAGAGHVDFLVNPYTGEVYGKPTGADFFEGVKAFHRFLLNKPEDTHGGLSLGRIVIGISAIAMTLILLSGIVVWWPKSRRMLRNRLTVSTRKGWRRFVYDSHVSLGIYAMAFLLLMALTGPAWSFGWYNTAAKTVMGFPQEETLMFGPQKAGVQDGQDKQQPAANAHSGATPQTEGHETKVRRWPAEHQMQGGPNFHQTLQSLHFGRWGGLLTRIIYLLAALIGGFLPLSGYYLWWKRTHPQRR